MKELLFGEANRFAGKSLQAGAQGQVLAFEPLHRGFAGLALLGRQTRFIRAPSVGEPLRHGPSSGFEYGQQAAEGGVGSPPKDEGDDVPMAASWAHQSQRWVCLQRTNDHISSAHKRNGFAGPGT